MLQEGSGSSGPGRSLGPPPPTTRRAARARREAELAAEQPAESPAEQSVQRAEPRRETAGRDVGTAHGLQPPPPGRRGSRAIRRGGDGGTDATSRTGGRAAPQRRSTRPARPGVYALLLGLALLLLAWALTALLDVRLPGAHAAAALSPLVSVLALPVLAVSAGRRSVVPAVVAVLAAIAPWVFAATYAAAGPGPTQARGHDVLRVMFVDAEDGAADARSVTGVARAQAADVVVVTGLTDALSHRLTVAGLNRLLPPRWVWTSRDHHSGIGVYTRDGTADLHLVPGMPRPTAQGLVTVRGRTIELVAAQLPGSVLAGGAGERGMRRLAELPALVPQRVLVGDLDAGPWNAGFRHLAGAGWRDAADVVGQGLRPTWPSWSPLPVTPADHVMVGRGTGAASADTVQVRGTDHRAVVVQVLLPGS